MSNTSATGGYLVPTADSPSVLEDAALDAFLQALVVGCTGIAGTLVRPRWQPTPPKQPEPTVDWCAIGVTEEDPDANAAFIHHAASDANPLGYDEMRRHETLTVLASFYGPDCRGNAKLLRDGLSVAQNREAMFLNNMGFVASGTLRMVPELVNQQWLRRADFDFVMRHESIRFYPVQNIVEAEGTIQTDIAGNTPWDSGAHR